MALGYWTHESMINQSINDYIKLATRLCPGQVLCTIDDASAMVVSMHYVSHVCNSVLSACYAIYLGP